jgi:hypothetical protein
MSGQAAVHREDFPSRRFFRISVHRKYLPLKLRSLRLGPSEEPAGEYCASLKEPVKWLAWVDRDDFSDFSVKGDR